MSPDVNLQPNEEQLEDMRLVQPAPCNLRFDTHELILMGRKEYVGADGLSRVLRASDVSDQIFKEIDDFGAKQLGARGETSSSEHGRQRRQEISIARTALATTTCCSVGRIAFTEDSTMTSVVSSANAPCMSVDEAPSGELLDDAQPKNNCRPLVPKNATRLAEIITGKREPSRSQFEPEEKRVTMGAGSSFLKIAKTHDEEPREFMIQLMSGEVLQYARANPVEEAKLGLELPGNIMASREIGDREERPSLAPREGPSQVERARQRRDLQSFRQRTCPTARNDMLGQ